MKKLIAFCLAMLLCLSVFAACDINNKPGEETTAGKEETTAGKEETTAGKEETTTSKEETTTEGTEETTTEETTTPGSAYDVEAAAAFLDAQYKNADTITPVDYEVFGQVMVGLDKYMVSWTTDSDKVTAVEGSPKWTIQVDELSLETVNYKIIGTITAPDGTTATVSYDRVVPKFEVPPSRTIWRLKRAHPLPLQVSLSVSTLRAQAIPETTSSSLTLTARAVTTVTSSTRIPLRKALHSV